MIVRIKIGITRIRKESNENKKYYKKTKIYELYIFGNHVTFEMIRKRIY